MKLEIKHTRFARISVLLLCAMAMQTGAATITVTNTNDSGPGSLRQALAVAHDGDRITFAVSGTITLTSGGLAVFKNVTISGPGADQLSIDVTSSPIHLQSGFYVAAIATISGLTIRNGADGIDNLGGTLTVKNCVISGNSIYGIYNTTPEFGTVTATILSTTVSGNSGGGISTQPNIFSGGATVTITDCTISGNFSSPGGGGINGTATSLSVANSTISGNSTARSGGGILLVNSFASIETSTISGNSAETSGGGIYGSATVENSTISGNSAGTSGGGIYGAATVENSTISGNSAGTSGGGIYGSATVENSTISGNSAGTSGGGIYGAATVENSTISGNSAGTSGGGIYNNSSLDVTLSTITGNSAPSGGGIYTVGSVEVSNTILNAGASGENIFNDGGTVTSLGYNLSSDDGGGILTGPGDQINTDPLLGPLQNNGGPTSTHALLPGSPAIDAGDPNFSPPPFNDQRGCHFDRVFNGRIDIGSFETQPPRRPCATPRPRPTPPPRP
jgi:predicted outer membrane repeat protein